MATEKTTEFINNLSDDLLTAIFIRVSDCRTVVQCRKVCNRWNSLLSDYPQFISIFIRHRRLCSSDSPPPCSFLLQKNIPFEEFSKTGIRIQDRSKYFDLENSIREKPPSFLSFLGDPTVKIRASFNDLLLVSSSTVNYHVCNTVTRRWVSLPEAPNYFRAPLGFGLVCKPISGIPDNCKYRYRVVLFFPGFPRVKDIMFQYILTVFSSETLRWTEHDVAWPMTVGPDSLANMWKRENDVVSCGGVLYWKRTSQDFVLRILRFDPFDGVTDFLTAPEKQHPHSVGAREYRLCVGECRGRLRICRMSVAVNARLVLEVWELRDERAWFSVHRKIFDMAGWRYFANANFHPYDEDVVFLYDATHVFRYDMSNWRLETIVEIPREIAFGEELSVFPLAKLSWPTPIPSLP